MLPPTSLNKGCLFQARGAFIGALSAQNTAFSTPVELQDALGLTGGSSAATTWTKRNKAYTSFAEGLVPISVPSRLSVPEAAALVEVWHRSEGFHSGSLLRSRVEICMCGGALEHFANCSLNILDLNESVFLAKLAETGGNPREFVRRGYLSTLVPF